MDNAATSWPKPPEVVESMTECLLKFCANPGRSGHDMALRSENMVYGCREKICELFGVENPENVIFTQNATHALNIVIKGILSREDHVIVTSMEHNSVMRPLASVGASYDMALANEYGYVDDKDIEKLIKPNTALIICTLSSNVCGSVQPFEKIAKIAKKHKIPFLLDASQGAGVIEVNMKKFGIDFLAAPGHKSLLGPTGTGILCINSDKKLRPFTEGGTGSLSKLIMQPDYLPDRFESGTLNVVGIAGLYAAIKCVLQKGCNEILYSESKICNYIADNLSSIPGIHLKGYLRSGRRTPVLSFTIDNVDSLIASSILNIEYGIACRAGFHCAYNAHCTLSTQKTGTIRLSPGMFTTYQEADKVLFAVSKIALQKI